MTSVKLDVLIPTVPLSIVRMNECLSSNAGGARLLLPAIAPRKLLMCRITASSTWKSTFLIWTWEVAPAERDKPEPAERDKPEPAERDKPEPAERDKPCCALPPAPAKPLPLPGVAAVPPDSSLPPSGASDGLAASPGPIDPGSAEVLCAD